MANERNHVQNNVFTDVALRERMRLEAQGVLRKRALSQQEQYRKALDEVVISQEHVKDLAAQMMYLINARAYGTMTSTQKIAGARMNTLFIGPSGCGKTLTASHIAHNANVPFAEFALLRVSSTGLVGGKIDDSFMSYIMNVIERERKKLNKEESRKMDDGELYERCHEKNYGIMFYDEIDKLAGTNDLQLANGGISKKVQQELLDILQGTTVDVGVGATQTPIGLESVSIPLNTSEMTFICAGAFTGLEEIIGKRCGLDIKKLTKRDVYDKMIADDLVEYGLLPELLRRFDQIITFDELTINDFVRIIRETKKSPVNIKRDVLQAYYGTKLTIEDNVYEYIASLSLKNKQLGAGALNQVCNDLLNPIMQRLWEYTQNDAVTITLPLAQKLLAKYELKNSVQQQIGFSKN